MVSSGWDQQLRLLKNRCHSKGRRDSAAFAMTSAIVWPFLSSWIRTIKCNPRLLQGMLKNRGTSHEE